MHNCGGNNNDKREQSNANRGLKRKLPKAAFTLEQFTAVQEDTKLKKRSRQNSTKQKPKEDLLLRDMPTNISFRVENGIRHLAPYWSIYRSQTKGRWVGRTVVDVFQDEFLSYNPFYAIAALRLGRILINGKQITEVDHRLRSGDSITHIHHKHEHSVLDKPIQIIDQNEQMFVVNKPPSLPVHACGQYKVNTVIGLLWYLHKITGLKVLHRLDRVTSGVLLFAKTLEADVATKQMMCLNEVRKEYVCKVKGRFSDGKIVCEQPLEPLVISLGIQQVQANGKPCKSTFERVWYDDDQDESLVLCHIESGRTHQIRVHLQFLGFPILNDFIYNSLVWGPMRGKAAQYEKSQEQLVADLKHEHSCSHWQEYKDPDYDNRLKEVAENVETQPEEWVMNDFKFEQRPEIDPICLFCHIRKRQAPFEHYWMPLHCWRYKSPKWTYTAELPDWAWPPPANAEFTSGLITETGNSAYYPQEAQREALVST